MFLPKHGRHVLHLYGYGFLIERCLQKIHNAPYNAFLHHQQFHAERFLRHLLTVLMPINAVCLKDCRAVRMVQTGVSLSLSPQYSVYFFTMRLLFMNHRFEI